MIDRLFRRIPLCVVCSLFTLSTSYDRAYTDEFRYRNVFASFGNGTIQQFSPSGELLDTLPGLTGSYLTGMAFDRTGSLYVTNFGGGSVSVFRGPEDPHGHSVLFGTDAGSHVESIVFDREGNIYVGQADGTRDVMKFSPQGQFIDRFNAATETRGSDWIDLAADQHTLFYTSEGQRIFRYDLATKTQLTDFNSVPLPGSNAFALRILPAPDNGVLVANRHLIARLDASGSVIKTYDAPGQDTWFAMNLDPDGISFWSGDYFTGALFRFDIDSGVVLLGPLQTAGGNGVDFTGIAVYGEVTVGLPEDCENGTDDDRDQRIDCADLDCAEECPPPECSPGVFYDEMDSELSHDIEVFGLGRVCGADLRGVVGVKTYEPYLDPLGRRVIDTRITKLELSGQDPACGDIRITLQADRPSTGRVVEKETGKCFPAESFFEVYIQVEVGSGDEKLVLVNCKAAVMKETVTRLPPIGGFYEIGEGFDVELFPAGTDCSTAGQPAGMMPAGMIKAAEHRPTETEARTRLPEVSEADQHRLKIYLPDQEIWFPLSDAGQRAFFKEDQPTALIVHGWQPLGEVVPANPLLSWMLDVARAVHGRVPGGVNILAWDWFDEAATVSLSDAASRVKGNAVKASSALINLFKYTYSQPIHMMGHSLGAYMLGYVADTLIPYRPQIDGRAAPVQVTLWDPPSIVHSSLASQVIGLRRMGVYVDLYSGATNDDSFFVDAWVEVPFTELDPITGHDVYNWYKDHAAVSSEPRLYLDGCTDNVVAGTVGLGASILVDAGFKRPVLNCSEPLLDQVFICKLLRCGDLDYRLFGRLCVDADKTPAAVVKGAILTDGECLSPVVVQCSFPSDTSVLLQKAGFAQGGGAPNDPPGSFVLRRMIDPTWDYFTFDYEFVSGPRSRLTFAIKEPVGLIPIQHEDAVFEFGEGTLNAGLIDVRPFHGNEVDFIFTFDSEDGQASILISTLQFFTDPFHDKAAPVTRAGDDRAVAVVGPFTTVSLDGAGTTDADPGDELFYLWRSPGGILGTQPVVTVDLPAGGHALTLTVWDSYGLSTSDEVIIEVENPFERGDSDLSGRVQISDAIRVFTWLFLDPTRSLCKDAADANDSGRIDISDGIRILNFLFLGAAAPPPPFGVAGLDPTPDLLGCDDPTPSEP